MLGISSSLAKKFCYRLVRLAVVVWVQVTLRGRCARGQEKSQEVKRVPGGVISGVVVLKRWGEVVVENSVEAGPENCV